MKRILFLLGLTFMLTQNTYAQYSETFSTANKGILGGPCTTNDPTTCSSNDFAGVNWTITGDLSGMDGTGPDDFRTSGGVMTSLNGDIDEEVCWVSPLLDISTAGAVSFAVDVSVSGHDGSDYLDVEYDIDQAGTWTQIANLAGGGTHTIDFGTNNNNHTELNVGASGLTGNTLQIRVCVDFNSNTESFTIDDAEVPQSGVTVVVPCTDMAPPTISCPGTQTRAVDSNCNYTVEDFTGLATTTDDCGPVTVTQSPTAGMTFNGIGNSPITLTATDGASNTASCSFTLTLEDNIPPTIVCPGTQNRTVNANCIYSLEDFTGSATVSDNCDNSPSVTQSPTSGTNLGLGNQVVTLTATDASGNASSCTFTVAVTDDTPPNAVCQDGTVQLDGSGNGSINSSALDGGSTDNCPGALSYVPTSFSFTCSNVGPNTVTVSVVDVSLNSATCTAVVTVQDNIPPTAVCQDATVVLSGTSATLSAGQVDGGSTDNCPPPALSVSPTMFDCSDVGTNPVTLLVVETSGGTGFSTCTATVTVQDNTPPTASCMPATIQVGQTLMPSQVDNGSSDNCTNPPDLSVSPNTFGCGNIGPNTVTLTADDTNGNTSTCTAIVTVEENSPPTAVCANTTVNLDGGGNASIVGADVDGGSSSVCNSVVLSVSPSSFDCNNIGPNTVTLTATDTGNSMTSTCTAVVTVADPLSACCAPPMAMCTNVTLELDANGDATASASAVGAGSTADCGLASETVNPSDFDCMDIGPNTVTYTITDVNGASSTCTAVATVEDNIRPDISCASDYSVNTDPGTCEATVTLALPTNSDNCAVTVLRHRRRLVDDMGNNIPGEDWSGWSPSTSPTITIGVGNWKIQWQAKDASNNQRKCSLIITVEDNEPPNAVCFDATVNFNGEAEIFLSAAQVYDDVSSSDNCGDPTLIGFSPASVTCDQLGTVVPVTVMIEDDSGNPGQCTANVTVGGLPCGFSANPDGINCPNGNQASYDPNSDTFMVTSEGCYDPNYYSNMDSHGFVGTQLCGDGEIIAEITNVNGNGFAGVSMREDFSPGSKMLQLSIDGVSMSKRELRQSTGGLAFNHLFQTAGNNWLRLTRSGNQFTAQHSMDGMNWSFVFITNISMPECIEIGLFTENNTPTGMMTGTFANVDIKSANGNLVAPDTVGEIVEQDTRTRVSVFPNPTFGEVVVDFGAHIGNKASLQVFNSQGHSILLKEIDEIQIPRERLDLSNYQNGLYFIRIQIPEQPILTQKLMLVREQ